MFIYISSLNITVVTSAADPGLNPDCDAISNNKSTICGTAGNINHWSNQFT
jgi:hypothetical protein